MLCIPIIGNSKEEILKQMREAQDVADLIELRLDLWDEVDIEWLKGVRSMNYKPWMITLRTEEQGGKFHGDHASWLKTLHSLLSLGPEFVDIEHNVTKKEFFDLKQKAPSSQWIVSYHHLEKTPNLEEIFHRLHNALKADIYKICTKAESSLDVLRMLLFVKKKAEEGFQLIGLCMGEEGKTTRILSKIVGSVMTFGSLKEEGGSTPCQLSANALLETYHYHQLNKATKIYGLIGSPVHASMSHVTHNKIFREMCQNAVYVKWDVEKNEIREFLDLAKELPIFGLSVTMPLKEEMSRFLEATDPYAKQIGSINTIVKKEDHWRGYNTDGRGALDALEKYITVYNKKVLILGAGGAARAIAYECKIRGAQVLILNRNIEKAKNVANELGCQSGSLREIKKDYSILINSTSVGMGDSSQETLVSKGDLKSFECILEVIHRPVMTQLLKDAIESGCQVVYGYEMFAEQAVYQFLLWMDSLAPHGIEELRQKVRDVIEDYIRNESK